MTAIMHDGFDDNHNMPTYISWDFNPYDGVRFDCVREVVFIEQWQSLMTKGALEPVSYGRMREDRYFIENESYRYPVLDIFEYTPTAHETRLASNFVLYLGRNNGAAFLYEANRLADKFAAASMSRPDAYLAQWALENNPANRWHMRSATPRLSCLQPDQKTFLEPELADIKVLECMVYWCGTDAGQRFLKACEDALSQNRAQQRSVPFRQIP